MEDVTTRITDYVGKIDGSIDSDDLLEFTVDDVIDRALSYMNREQLVIQFEEDLVDYPEADDDFWEYYEYPIPVRVERVLARAVVNSYKSQDSSNSDEFAIKSSEDLGQKVSFSDKLTNYLSTATDSEVFSGTTSILDKFRLATVVENI